MNICRDDLADGSIINLLNRHLKEMVKYSPPESIHALDENKLFDPAITFWRADIDNELAGCGALKEIDHNSAELKSMKTDDKFIRRGVAQGLLMEIIAEAKFRNYTNIYLETGSHSAFLPAIELYKKHGFTECGPFADYKLDPYSVFYKLEL